MIRIRTLVLPAAMLACVAAVPAPARAGWGVRFNIGLPIFVGPCWGYYPYRPVYVAPAPVYVPAPVVVQPAAVAQPIAAAQPAYQTSAPPPAYMAATPQPLAHAVALDRSDAEVAPQLRQLSDPDERTRAASAMALGRLRAVQAVDPLAATLAGDRSPAVREAAARALALIGSPKAMPALQQAALADPDRDVRHSAQFAVDVVQVGR